MTNIVIKPFTILKTLHQRLLSIDVDNIPETNDYGRNPYQMFLGWLLDVIEDGIVLYVARVIMFGYRPSILLAPIWILGHGLVLDILRRVVNIMKGKT